jgi:hypothetical protein
MTPEIMRAAFGATPFVPFTLSLSDQREVGVPSTQDVELSEDGKTLSVERDGVRVLIATAHVVSINFERRGTRAFGFGS